MASERQKALEAGSGGGRAYLAMNIDIRRRNSPAEGTWHELVAVGWDGNAALLASFRSKRAAEKCKRLVMNAVRLCMREA